jgi:hypothetical protein
LLSGRLPYHVNQINLGGYYPRSGIARNMTIIPRKLKGAGCESSTTAASSARVAHSRARAPGRA